MAHRLPDTPAPALAGAFQRTAAAGNSPLHRSVAAALAGSPAAMRALTAAPARGRHPAAVLAALHDLALAGKAPALAAAHAAGDADAAAVAAVETLLVRSGEVAALVARRRPQTFRTQPCAVLHPAVAEAARRTGTAAVGLVAVMGMPGLDLHLDRVGIRCSSGQVLGDPSSPVQLAAELRGPRSLPAGALPVVVARIAVDDHPVDVTDPADARWLRACLPPDQPERAARLDAALAVAAAAPPALLAGDLGELLPGAVARVPTGALPVVTTTWALARFPPAGRLRFLHRLQDAAAGRPVAWVSVEGVGVAPSVPTLGDRPASGHSTIGLAVLEGSPPRPEAVGRCWSRGRVLEWLSGP